MNDVIKIAVRGKEVLAASDEEAKERCREVYRDEKRKLKGVYIGVYICMRCVNREALWQLLRMYDVRGGINFLVELKHDFDSSACVKVEGRESKQFRI